MGTHFFHFENDRLKEWSWNTSSDGKPNIKLESTKGEELHIFFDRDQLEKLAMSIHRYLVLTDAREKALAKALPDPPDSGDSHTGESETITGNEVWL